MDELPAGKTLFRPRQMTLEEIKEGCIKLYGPNNTEMEICVAQEELRAGVDFIRKYDRSVTIFGSHILGPDTEMYQKAERLAGRIVKELGYAVTTGGGPGIMEAANKGAKEAGGKSLGLTIGIHGETPSQYLTDRIDFNFFFNRKTILAYGAETYLYFPGSFGTMDEMFTILILIATGKIPVAPVVMVGTEYWKDMEKFLEDGVRDGVTPEHYLKFYTITDDEDEIINIIKNAPARRDLKTLSQE
jgi:uncharacterized protein (TIGR00730 family)